MDFKALRRSLTVNVYERFYFTILGAEPVSY